MRISINKDKVCETLDGIIDKLSVMEDSIRDNAIDAPSRGVAAYYQNIATHLGIAHGILADARDYSQNFDLKILSEIK